MRPQVLARAGQGDRIITGGDQRRISSKLTSCADITSTAVAIAIGLSVQGSRSALMLLLLMVNGVVTLAGLLVLKIEPSSAHVKCGCKGRPTAITI
jgi:hypothetical protein